MSLLLIFLFPYAIALYGAAYNVNQVLEGIIRHSPEATTIPDGSGPLVSIFEPVLNTDSIFLVLILYCAVLLLPTLLVSGYVIKRWKGCVAVLVVLGAPGFFALLGFFPQFNFLPHELYLDTSGVLGIAWGMAPLVILSVLTGWSGVLLLSDALQLKDNFRHLYDHGWYGIAVLAGIFFVADIRATHTAHELQRENELSRQASAYLLRQVRDYDIHCHSERVLSKASCVWASRVQQRLNDYTSEDERLFHVTGPKDTSEIYDPFRYGLDQAKISVIRRELKEFNANRCPRKSLGSGWYQSTISGVCQSPPASFLKVFPEPLDGQVDRDYLSRVVTVANEAIAPSLVASRERQEQLKQEIDQHNRYLNFKWVFYILFSIIAGGKIANSTARLVNIGNQPPNEQQRSFQALFALWGGLKKTSGVFVSAILCCRKTLRQLRIKLFTTKQKSSSEDVTE